MIRVPLLVLAVLAARGTSGACADAPPVPVSVERPADRIAVARCLGNNVVAVSGDDGVLVVDANRSPTIMRGILVALADSLGRDDYRWLVDTHADADHCGGNAALASATCFTHALGAEAIDAFDARSRLVRHRLEVAFEAAREDAANHPSAAASARLEAARILRDDARRGVFPPPPDVTFRDRTQVDCGGLTAELIFAGAGHTDHDVFVFVPDLRLLATGDVFCARLAPCFHVDASADVPRLLAVLDHVLAVCPDELHVIPGHGEPLSRDDLVELRGVLAERFADVRPERSAAWQLARDANARPDAGWDWDEEELHAVAARLLARGRFGRAHGILTLALERLPGSALLHDTMGEACLLRGDVPAALRHYERSLELQPANRNAAEMAVWLRAGGS